MRDSIPISRALTPISATVAALFNQSSENRTQVKNTCTVNAKEYVVNQSNTSNGDDADPCVTRIEQLPGIDMPIGNVG